MKPLTIEELKALEIGDWVWVITEHYSRYVWIFNTEGECLHYQYSDIENRVLTLSYYDYSTKWLAFKNKEMAESKGEIVETGKYFIEPERLPNRPLRYLICDYSVSKGVRDMCDTLEEAERRLAELKGEKK